MCMCVVVMLLGSSSAHINCTKSGHCYILPKAFSEAIVCMVKSSLYYFVFLFFISSLSIYSQFLWINWLYWCVYSFDMAMQSGLKSVVTIFGGFCNSWLVKYDCMIFNEKFSAMHLKRNAIWLR